ncbi:unnamed protein product [Rotaria sp. Silwood1]|nr:unnamed protein product [Rotaria sp. Silwood1]CAF1613739.1 unnamed protein product [Rotaria sp. Silwood1]CAF3735834.1 unnamed protein product [Rotaria sp. Silwood1]CAF4816058.1 unnamed protein product [Rotaria sp. Silwood1]CAF4846645.1 unnamed protein product [Rotaria sp. Silwood1]
MAIVLYAPALALSQTTGLNIWLSVVSISVICTFYSSVGGMKAVIWTDVLQAVVIVIGLLAVIIQGLITVGGFKQTFSIASQGGRIQFDRISFDPRTRFTVWSLVIGGCFNSLATYGFNQTQIQRYLAIRSTRGAKQALLIDAIGGSFIVLLTILIGVIMYAYYADCDPYTNKQIEHIDQILPYFVMEVLGDKKGLPGIFLACVFSGSLSTISSGLNSLTAVIIEDFYKGLMGRQLSDERQGFIAKILSVVLGACIMLLTYVVSHLGSILNATLSLFGVLEGPNMGVFVLGFLFPQANRRGALVGFFSSLALQLWMFLGAQITQNQMESDSLPLSIANCSGTMNSTLMNRTTTTMISTFLKRDLLIDLYSVSYLWYSPIAVGTVVLVGMTVSYLTHPLQSHEIDPKLIVPVSDVCCCFLPKRWREWLQCGIDYETYRKRQNDNNELEMVTNDTQRSGRESPIVPLLDTNSNVFVTGRIKLQAKLISPTRPNKSCNFD